MVVPPLLAVLLLALAAITHVWILSWPAAVLGALWVAYLVGAPRALGKRADGTISIVAWLFWAPVFLYQWIAHEVIRRFSTEPVATEVGPGVWVGRRPRAHELPDGVAIVVDLCAEFAAARGVRSHARYLAVPTLDASSPSRPTSHESSTRLPRPTVRRSSTARSATGARRRSPPR